MKIIHVADVHWGAEPDLGFAWSKERKAEIPLTFRKVITICRDEKTDLLLIAGDLFHRPPLLRELREVNYLFKAIPDTTVVLMAGNHDYLKKGGYSEAFSWNENVIGLWGKSCERVEIPELDLAVYGCSYHEREIREPLYDEVYPEGDCRYHILLAHGGDSAHSPINKEKLLAAGFDYVALGHIHKPQILAENKMAYAGALEPIDCNDFGQHGYMQVEITGNRVSAAFVPLPVFEYKILEMQVDEETTQFALEEQVGQRIRQMGEKAIYHLHLVGTRERKMEFNLLRLLKLGRIIRVKDSTKPYYDLEELEQKYEGSLIGEFIGRLKDLDGVEKKALYYGLEALLETKR